MGLPCNLLKGGSYTRIALRQLSGSLKRTLLPEERMVNRLSNFAQARTEH